MLRYIFLLATLLIVGGEIMAQRGTGSVRGIVRDSVFAAPPAGKGVVEGAVVTLMRQRDSSLITFTMTDTLGAFTLKGVGPGNYRVLITHTAYRSYSRKFTVSPDTLNVELKNIYVTHRSVLLSEVVVEEEAPPVTLKGDTLEFNASSYRTAPNASAEDLMKKLPGVKVNSDGTYTVNGQKVTKILVDGKEFFSDDPALAGRNIQADAVKKVQVFQRASETEAATGVKDGSSETTINLTLKDDKKNGSFGMASVGAGTDNRYRANMNYNRFNGNRRVSLLANANNINERAFSFQDAVNMSSGFSQGGGMFRMLGEDGGGMGMGVGNGINTSWAGGVNFTDEFGKNLTFTGNYFYTKRQRELESSSEQYFALPDSAFNRFSNSLLDNYTDNHRINFNAEFRVDSLTKIRMRTGFTYTNSRSNNFSGFNTTTASGGLINTGSNNNFSGRDAYSFNNEITFTRRMLRKGRNFSITWRVNQRYSDNFSEPENSTSFFTESGSFTRLQRQRNRTDDTRSEQTLNISWTEPVGKYSKLVMSIDGNTRTLQNDRNVYKVDTLDNSSLIFQQALSNNFALTFRYAGAGIRYNFEKKKKNITLGATLRQSQLVGESFDLQGSSSRVFTNILPFFRLSYDFSKVKKLWIVYSTDLTPPDVTSLNPVLDISDPLNISSGNASLRPEELHNLFVQYMAPDPTGSFNFVVSSNFSRSLHAVVNSVSLDTLGRRFSIPVNGKPRDNGYVMMNISYDFEKLFSNIDLTLQPNYSRTWSVINSQNNRNTSLSTETILSWNFTPTDSFEIGVRGSLLVSDGRFTLTPQNNNRFITQTYTTSLSWQTKWGIVLESAFDYNIATNQNTGVQTRFPLWTSSVSWMFLKADKGQLKLTVFDMLNTNTGIEQNVEDTFVEIQRYTTLRRYAMLSFTYKLGKAPEPRMGGHRMMMMGR
ncbi:MAG: TonB dependent receptor [Bacteroidia bacterium]|jgi:hypothetical protein|nr:TonB dependent receptor [Bacteroidia bacterium]